MHLRHSPIVRLTNLGIRLVEKEALEAADAFGADYRQKLFGVQIRSRYRTYSPA